MKYEKITTREMELAKRLPVITNEKFRNTHHSDGKRSVPQYIVWDEDYALWEEICDEFGIDTNIADYFIRLYRIKKMISK